MARKRSPAKVTSAPLETTTSRDFSGGWNTAESEVLINSRYATILDNMYYSIDGVLKVRPGSDLHADLETIATADWVDGCFFFAYIISVAADGSVYATDGQGNSAKIWPKTGVDPWSDTVAVSFVEMNGTLIIHNGIQKPIQITTALVTNYLTDVDGTNLDVPIGLVAARHSESHVIAVGSAISVSHPKAPGTFVGDPPPNIGVLVELGSRVTRGSKTITAMVSYRDVLLVMFAQCIVPVQWAPNDAGTALIFTIDDAIDNYGAFSHRVVQNLGDDVLFCDIVGVQSVKRTVFSKTLTPAYRTQIISSPVQAALDKLSTSSLRNRVFSVFDVNEKAYILFIPNDDVEEATYEHTAFINTKQESPTRIDAWARFHNWRFVYACRSAEGRLFFGVGKQIYQFGREAVNDIHVDYRGDQETFTDGTPFEDLTGFNPVANVVDSGIPITFDWELPWSFMKKRENIKKSKFLTVDTEGFNTFTASMFVDYLYVDPLDRGEFFTDDTSFTDETGFLRLIPLTLPQLSTEFIGKDSPQYGEQTYGSSPYGGGRSTAETRTYKWPAKFKLMKLKFTGEATSDLRIVGITLSYQMGSTTRGA